MPIDVVIRSNVEEPRHLSLDPSQLSPKGLSGAKTLVDVLALTGSVTRGSVVTGRVQTLTGKLEPEAGRAQVRIDGDGNEPLVTIETSCLGAGSGAPGMVLTLGGPMSDPTIDEACGLGLHIGAAILARPRPRAPLPTPARRPPSS